jgi:hypothetical protein
MVNPRSKQWQAVVYQSVLASIIAVDLMLLMLLMLQSNTDTHAPPPLHHTYATMTRILQCIVSGFFVLDYVVRVVTITERAPYQRYGPWKGRLVYMVCSGASWMDACALAPTFIPPSVERNTWSLRVVLLPASRLCRLSRLSKIRALFAPWYYNAEILSVALLVAALGTAVLWYELRPPPAAPAAGGDGADTSDHDFASVASALYARRAASASHPQFIMEAKMVKAAAEINDAKTTAALTYHGKSDKDDPPGPVKSAIQPRDGQATHGRRCTFCNSGIAGEGAKDSDNQAAQSQWLQQQVKETFVHADLDGTGTLSLSEAAELVTASQKPPEASTPIDAIQQLRCMERLHGIEADLQKTNHKLDLILQLLQNRA